MGMIKIDEYTLNYVFNGVSSVFQDLETGYVTENTFSQMEQIKRLIELMKQEREKMDIRDILYKVKKNLGIKQEEPKNEMKLRQIESQLAENRKQLMDIRKEIEEFITIEGVKT